MTIYEDDVYTAEHEALQRIENVVWRIELDEKELHRVAGYIAGIRAMGGKLLDMIAEDKKNMMERLMSAQVLAEESDG